MKLIRKEFIFNDPLPTPECHASTVITLEDGGAIAAWFGGTKEAEPDVSIWCSRRENGVWSEPKAVSPEQNIQHWNPVLFKTDVDTVSLFYKVGFPISDWKTMVITTRDGGRTWSSPTELVENDASGGRGPVKNKPLLISNGNILAGGSTERGAWRCFVDVFDGKTWQKKDIPVNAPDAEKLSVIQPTLWESREGYIHALMRSNQGKIYRSDSLDFGNTWSEIYPTDMPNNNSGIDCVMTDSGTLILVCNPVSKDWGARSPLTVFTSADNGKTFEKQLDLECEEGEFSYPAVISKGNRIFITYTYKRKKIAYCELEL